MQKISSCYGGVREISCNITHTSITKIWQMREITILKLKKL